MKRPNACVSLVRFVLFEKPDQNTREEEKEKKAQQKKRTGKQQLCARTHNFASFFFVCYSFEIERKKML